MKQLVQRKTLTGGWEAFTFEKKSRYFFVKNFTEGDVFVSFENNDEEDESVKILSNTGEEVAISFNDNNTLDYFVNTVYVKGTGEVEVDALDAYVE